VTGPLVPFVAGFLEDLAERGYSQWSATAHLQVMRHLSLWLAERELGVAELTAPVLTDFVQERRSRGYAKGQSAHGMVRVLTNYLQGVGAMPEAPPQIPETPIEQLLEEFKTYLREERGLAERTLDWYRYVAELFLKDPGCNPGVVPITAEDIYAFMRNESNTRSVGSLNNVATGLRALLRFLYMRGHIHTSLAAAVPWAPGWRDSGLPRGLEMGQVERLLSSCDRVTVSGRRDFAILTLLSRLGLRAGEVASLRVDDVDWRNGQILVTGKGNRRDSLPLPTDVGEALADYCHQGRPHGWSRALFLQLQAPYGPLTSDAVNRIVGAAARRAGLPRVGPHRLRHSAATAMRRAGAPLFEIGQVLRHRHTATTAGYARDDLGALLAVARPWPGGAA